MCRVSMFEYGRKVKYYLCGSCSMKNKRVVGQCYRHFLEEEQEKLFIFFFCSALMLLVYT